MNSNSSNSTTSCIVIILLAIAVVLGYMVYTQNQASIRTRAEAFAQEYGAYPSGYNPTSSHNNNVDFNPND